MIVTGAIALNGPNEENDDDRARHITDPEALAGSKSLTRTRQAATTALANVKTATLAAAMTVNGTVVIEEVVIEEQTGEETEATVVLIAVDGI